MFFKITINGRYWLLFLALVATNTLLSYGSFSFPVKGFLFLFGIALPLVLAFQSLPRRGTGEAGPFTKEFLPTFPAWLLLLLALAALFIRFYRLTDLFLWPGLDESLLGMFAIRLSEKWDWRFFYSFGQVPPLPIWSSALLLKAGAPAFFSLWFPSAVVSSLTVFTGYAAARQFFPRSFAFLCAGVLAFGYWPFLLGRICHQGIWLPLWVCLCLFFLGRFLKASTPSGQRREAVTLGFATGLGSFTFTPWPCMALAVLGGAFCGSPSKPLRNARHLPYFLGAMLAAMGPFLFAVWREGWGQHIGAMSALSGWFSWKHQVLTVLSYLTEMLWGTLEGDSAYVAAYGGMLNPLWGAVFLLGLLQMIKDRSSKLIQWVGLAFLLGMLPGLLSMNVEMFRVAAALPFLLFTTVLGLAGLLTRVPPGRRVILLTALFILGAGIDGWRILKSQGPPSGKPSEDTEGVLPLADLRAYGILKEASDRLGPGWIFTEFTENPYDQSLFDATYAFNAAENPRLQPNRARWAGLLTNVHYLPFLSPRFPGAAWYRLGGNLPGDQGMLLGMIPLTEKTLEPLGRWTQAHHYFRSLGWAINSISEDRTYAAAEGLFVQKPALVGEDPFLESCYWERRAEFYYSYNFHLHYQDQLRALRQALQSGYPAAHLYYKLGSLLMRKREFGAARKALQSALKLEPSNPDVLNAISVLGELEKKAPTPK
jgi:hypothetical protein